MLVNHSLETPLLLWKLMTPQSRQFGQTFQIDGTHHDYCQQPCQLIVSTISTCFMLQFSVEKQRFPTMRSKYWSKCLNLANHHGKVFCLKAETTTCSIVGHFSIRTLVSIGQVKRFHLITSFDSDLNRQAWTRFFFLRINGVSLCKQQIGAFTANNTAEGHTMY